MKNRFFACAFIVLLAVCLPGVGNTAHADAPAAQSAMVAAAWEQTAELTPDGYLLVVGNNEVGQIGNGQRGDFNWDTHDKYVTKPLVAMKDVISMSVQNLSCYAIKKDHTLWSWGFDHCAALGNGPGENSYPLPTQIMDHVKFVATGHGLHMLAIKDDNTLWGWGQNDFGQVGNGTKTDVESPVKVTAISGVKFAAVGYGTSAVIKNDNTLWMWGRNDHGELGNGTRRANAKPVKVMDNVATVTLGFHTSCALKKDGTLWAWGWNVHGEIGDGTTKERWRPVKVMSGVASITSKADGHILAIKKDGTLWSWGDNSDGQVGDGTRTERHKPVKVMADVKMVDSGYNFSIALKKDDTVWTWGMNNSGQLGTLDTKIRLKPTKVLDLKTAVTGGRCTMPALFVDGLLDDWNNPEPIIRDDPADAAPGKADLANVYGYMDGKYLYMAATVGGKRTSLHLDFDNNGDGKPDYNVTQSSDRNYAFVTVYTDKGGVVKGPELLTCNYNNNTFELMIPLSAVGNPTGTSVTVCVNNLGDDTNQDKADGWTVVPVK